jgi:hypothetical protein
VNHWNAIAHQGAAAVARPGPAPVGLASYPPRQDPCPTGCAVISSVRRFTAYAGRRTSRDARHDVGRAGQPVELATEEQQWRPLLGGQVLHLAEDDFMIACLDDLVDLAIDPGESAV